MNKWLKLTGCPTFISQRSDISVYEKGISKYQKQVGNTTVINTERY